MTLSIYSHLTLFICLNSFIRQIEQRWWESNKNVCGREGGWWQRKDHHVFSLLSIKGVTFVVVVVDFLHFMSFSILRCNGCLMGFSGDSPRSLKLLIIIFFKHKIHLFTIHTHSKYM